MQAKIKVSDLKSKSSVAVIGAGAVGSMTAFFLAKKGYKVCIIDPKINPENNSAKSLTGSIASLGVLMGNSFHRSKGRSWELRQRSMKLWPDLIKEICVENQCLSIDTPLIRFATNKEESIYMNSMCKERRHLGLEFFRNFPSEDIRKLFPNSKYGGTVSHLEGRLDPVKLLGLLKYFLKYNKVEFINKKVKNIKRLSWEDSQKWEIELEDNEIIKKNTIVICAALGTRNLVKSLGHEINLSPVLGQALEIEVEEDVYKNLSWPGVISFHGVNIIPNGRKRVLIGATLENNIQPDYLEKLKMLEMNKFAPRWIKEATIIKEWHGIRARPDNESSPILKSLEKGLIINSGHYRNGILISPGCAEWVTKEISKENHQ